MSYERGAKERTGEIYGSITLTGKTEKIVTNKRIRYKYEGLCKCGNLKFFRVDSLISGEIKSCGCLKKAKTITNKRIYSIATRMFQRSTNPNCSDFYIYGAVGRGCTIGKTARECYEFLLTLPGYDDKKQLDRIDNSKGYDKDNVRWVTPSENCLNRKSSKDFTYYREFATTRSSFKSICKRRGWNFEDFEEIFSGEVSKGLAKNKLYNYKKIEG